MATLPREREREEGDGQDGGGRDGGRGSWGSGSGEDDKALEDVEREGEKIFQWRKPEPLISESDG